VTDAGDGPAAHRALFDGFAGEKRELTSRDAIAAFSG
jgi:hypothetical protein